MTDVMPRLVTPLDGNNLALPALVGRPLTLSETRDLIEPVKGPQDPIGDWVDVMIVGAGPIGLTVANLLGSFGIQCLLVEQKATTSDTPKAIAIDDEYMRVLDMLGLSGTLRPHLSQPFGIHFLSPFGFALVKVPGFVTPNGFGNRNAVLQPVFEKVLLEGCRRSPTVKIHFDTVVSAISQDDQRVATTLQTASGTYAMFSRYVLACDGARSFIRTSLNIPFAGTRIDEPHLVVDLADFPDQANHSRFFCNPVRPVNSVPAPYGGRRIEFMLSPDDDHQRVVTDEGIRELVDRHTPYRGVPLHIVRRAIYGFSERIADRLSDGRVFLLGDAAHVMPPFGGQGMNTGARDAANLCWKLVSVLRRQTSHQITATYDQERREHIRATMDYSVRVGRLANLRSRSRSILRDTGFALANLVPSVRRYFREMRHIPKPFIKQGVLVKSAEGDDDITGRILPRLALLGSSGQAVSIDDVAGSWFALVGLDIDARTLTAIRDHSLWRRLEPNLVPLTTERSSGRDGETWLSVADDRGRALLARYAGKILILRPDRVVAGCAAPAAFEALSNQLEAILGCPAVPVSPDATSQP